MRRFKNYIEQSSWDEMIIESDKCLKAFICGVLVCCALYIGSKLLIDWLAG
jgi:hypothetical protein